MLDKLQLFLILTLTILLLLLLTSPTWAQPPEQASLVTGTASTAGFLLLLPLGLILFLSSSLPDAEKIAPQAAASAFVVWGVAVLAYFGAGFAFQFGGLSVSNPHPDFAELYWNWSPLDASFGTGWGMIGLRGWALLGPAATPGVYDLFLRHVALLGVTVVAPTFILYRRAKVWMLLAFGLLSGTLLYPLAGNWLWSAGWLANLGVNLQLGHGFVDAGMALPFVIAGAATLAALLVFRRNELRVTNDELRMTKDELRTTNDEGQMTNDKLVTRNSSFVTQMPAAHLPLLSFFGLGMILWSWAFIASGQHIPAAVEFAMPRAALNGILAAFSAAVLAALYSRFTTAQFNPLMTSRGALAGLILLSAAAPFVSPWQAVAAGGVAGLLLPLFIYLIDHTLKLDDHTGGVATFGVMGVLGWLLVGLLADGSSGVGWNNVGMETYLSVGGQGVSGLLAAPGYVPDWPAQMNAQLLGAVSIVAWAMLVAGGMFKIGVWLMRRREEKTPEAEEA
ncbi:MAG TPA: hypothetical protein G4N96_03290 [Chloroflexi bacterium]|nr:hypothetical protein [Chloroflexota bacterium]